MPRSVFDHVLGEMLQLQALYFQDGGLLTDKIVTGGILEEICEKEGLRAGSASLGLSLEASRATEGGDDGSCDHEKVLAEVEDRGFAVVDVVVGEQGGKGRDPEVDLADDVRRAIDAVVDRGLPPVFALAFDCTWMLLDGQMGWLERSQLLGEGDVVIEPDINCWKLRVRVPGVGDKCRIGDNFSKPHRDLRHDQCHDRDSDALTAVSLWVPVNESGATGDNGGMRCVPIEEDDFFYSPDHPSHMNTNAENAARTGEVLTALKGHACLWQPSLVHFGGSFQEESVLEPRMSVAATFRAKNAPRCEWNGPARMAGTGGEDGPGPLARADLLELSLEKRLSYAAKAVLAYSHWSPGLPGCDLVAITNA